jgi:hypothetical protein
LGKTVYSYMQIFVLWLKNVYAGGKPCEVGRYVFQGGVPAPWCGLWSCCLCADGSSTIFCFAGCENHPTVRNCWPVHLLQTCVLTGRDRANRSVPLVRVSKEFRQMVRVMPCGSSGEDLCCGLQTPWSLVGWCGCVRGMFCVHLVRWWRWRQAVPIMPDFMMSQCRRPQLVCPCTDWMVCKDTSVAYFPDFECFLFV